MKITADTNILVRALVRDHASQSQSAARILREAELIAVPLACLCELVWVLRRAYGLQRDDILVALETTLEASNVVVNRAAAEGGSLLCETEAISPTGSSRGMGNGWAEKLSSPSIKELSRS